MITPSAIIMMIRTTLALLALLLSPAALAQPFPSFLTNGNQASETPPMPDSLLHWTVAPAGVPEGMAVERFEQSPPREVWSGMASPRDFADFLRRSSSRAS